MSDPHPDDIAIDTETGDIKPVYGPSPSLAALAETLWQQAKAFNFSNAYAAAYGYPKSWGCSIKVEWPDWDATPDQAMVAGDLLEERGYAPSTLPLLRKIFPSATEADLAAMLETPCAGNGSTERVSAFVHDDVHVETSTVPLDQRDTDAVIEGEISWRAGLQIHRRLIRALGNLSSRAPYVQVDGAWRSVKQHGGRHSSPVARAWRARVKAAEARSSEDLHKLLDEYSAKIRSMQQEMRVNLTTSSILDPSVTGGAALDQYAFLTGLPRRPWCSRFRAVLGTFVAKLP